MLGGAPVGFINIRVAVMGGPRVKHPDPFAAIDWLERPKPDFRPIFAAVRLVEVDTRRTREKLDYPACEVRGQLAQKAPINRSMYSFPDLDLKPYRVPKILGHAFVTTLYNKIIKRVGHKMMCLVQCLDASYQT